MKDATVEIIGEISQHPNADNLEILSVLGFNCVARKGVHKKGGKIVFVRPDSILPIEDWSEKYRLYCPKRVRAIKLRGEWSEGLIINLDDVPFDIVNIPVGEDVSQLLKITHYEPPISQELNIYGELPFGIGKTDEERVENIENIYLPFNEPVDISLKIDGQSCSFFYNIEQDRFGVLARNFELKEEFHNNYTDHVERYDIKNKLIAFCKKHNVSLCLRGESYGMGIQKNPLNPSSKKNKGWMMFSVYNISERKYCEKGSEFYFENVGAELDLPIVPIIQHDIPFTQAIIDDYGKNLTMIDSNYFEGVVIKHRNGSFKIINKFYDSKK